jgi:hypothetical protein
MFNEHLCRQVSRLFLQGVIAQRAFLERIGGFDEELLADDYGLIMRAFHAMRGGDYRFHFAEDSLWLYRVHPQNVHANSARQRQLVFEVVERYVPRERWPLFQLDYQAPTSFEDFEDLQGQLARHFGAAGRGQLSVEATRRYAYSLLERKDLHQLGQLLRSRHGLTAAVYVAPRLYRLLRASR